MTYPFYKDVLKEIGYKIQYEAISNLYGDSYAGAERSEMIEKHNPFNVKGDGQKENGQKVTLGMLQQMGMISQ